MKALVKRDSRLARLEKFWMWGTEGVGIVGALDKLAEDFSEAMVCEVGWRCGGLASCIDRLELRAVGPSAEKGTRQMRPTGIVP
jgi:hypothetical protein